MRDQLSSGNWSKLLGILILQGKKSFLFPARFGGELTYDHKSKVGQKTEVLAS